MEGVAANFKILILAGLAFTAKADSQPRDFSAVQSKTETSFIASLPLEMRSNYTLMKASESIQEATPSDPRAILFSSNGDTFITFNGHGGMKGGNAVEIMQFVETPEPHFVMRELNFDPSGKSLPTGGDTVNPAKCMTCHGNPPKPVWGDYDSANGAYGAGIDGIKKISGDDSPPEAEDFKKYLAEAATNPRYKALYHDPDNHYFPFAEAGGSPKIATAPNIRLASLLDLDLAKVAAAKVVKDPFLYSLLSAKFCSFGPSDSKNVEKISALIDVRRGKKGTNYVDTAKTKPDEERDDRDSAFFQGKDTETSPVRFYGDNVREAMGLNSQSLNTSMGQSDLTVSQTGYRQTTAALWSELILH